MGPSGEQTGDWEPTLKNKLDVPKGETFTAITVSYLFVVPFSLHLHLDLLWRY